MFRTFLLNILKKIRFLSPSNLLCLEEEDEMFDGLNWAQS